MESKMEDSCDLLTENGDRCGDPGIMTKQVNDKCKHYCKNHVDKVALDLMKRYNNVTVNDVKCNIESREVSINGKLADNFSFEELLNELVNSPTISIVIKCDKILISQDKLVIGWGKDLERWISSDWNINSEYLILYYSLNYKDDETSLVCTNVDTDYKTESLLGKGAYGKVSLITLHDNSDKQIVVKEVSFSWYYKIEEVFILTDRNIKELCFLAQYSHPNISKLKCVEYPTDFDFEKDTVNLKFHLNNAGISLDKLTSKTNPSINKVHENITYILFQLLCLFSDMEQLNIIHGDIKPGNIAIDPELNITVLDWGSVCTIPKYKYEDIHGTTVFMSPEGYYNEDKYIGPINDIWSLGLTILFLYHGDYKYLEIMKYRIETDYFKEYIHSFDKKIKTLSAVAKQELENIRYIIKDMLEVDYKKRKSATKLLSDRIFINYTKITKFNIKKLKLPTDTKVFERDVYINMIYRKMVDFKFISFILACKLFDLYLKFKSNKFDFYIYNKEICQACVNISLIITDDYTILEYIKKDKGKIELNITLDILKTLNFTVIQEQFDTQLENPNYQIIKSIMLDSNNIGLSDYEYLDLYNNMILEK